MKPTSVTVLSILGIIFGIMGFCGLFVLLLPFLPETPGDPLVLMKKDSAYIAFTTVGAIVGVILGIVLLLSSIGSLRLYKPARTGMLVYAWLAIAQCVIATVIHFLVIIPRALDLIGPGSPIGPMLPTILYASGCAGVIGLIYPICIIYFFTRKNVIDAFNGIFPATPTPFPVQPPASSEPQDPLFP